MLVCKTFTADKHPHVRLRHPVIFVLRILGPGPLAAVATVVYMTATTLYCSTVLFPDDIRRILNITSFGGQQL